MKVVPPERHYVTNPHSNKINRLKRQIAELQWRLYEEEQKEWLKQGQQVLKETLTALEALPSQPEG